jgi:hypothetical protein
MKGDTKTSKKHFDRYYKLDKLANKDQGVSESASTDDKKQISKYEELALAANRAGDDEKCKLYQKKIQALKQKMSKKIEEAKEETKVGIEAYGVRGVNSNKWKKTFKSQEAFEKWLDQNEGDVEVSGTREVNLNDMFKESMKEAKLDEEDIIIVPGQGKKYKQGFIPKAKDRTDHEVEMALSDLFQSAKNAKQVYELIKDIPEEVGIEGWVQEKIIKANDYLNTIREYLEHKQMGQGMAEGEENKSSAYQAGFSDGKRGSSDPRASSKYGPGSNDYTAGYRDGLKHEEQSRKDRLEQYRASIAPYVKMSDDKLAQLESDITQRRDEIVAASRSGKSTPAMKQEYKELNDKFQAINQAKFQKKNTQQNGMAEGYRILPNIDREKYQEREGLEGPFRARNGKVYYYDPKAGLAYDPDTDFYIDYDTLTMMDREMSEGVIGKVLAGTALLASLWGIGQQQAQQVYSNSPQLQTLIKYHQMATQQNDQAKIQEIERRIENHKTRLSLGKGEVMGADDKPIVPKYESSIMRGLQNEQTNDWGSMSKRDFKRREMEHELGHETRKTYNKPKGMFFYNVPAGKETDASRAGLKQSKSGKWYGYQDNMLGKGRYWEPKNESVTENTDQEHDSASLQKHFGAEVAYDAASHSPKMMQRKDLKGNSYQLIRLPNKNYKATLVTENTDKCPKCGGKLVAESELNEEGNKDACYHKVKSRYKVWPSAYASGALVKCRKVGASNWGNKSK